jgi:enterochelin esterase-like enzyme
MARRDGGDQQGRERLGGRPMLRIGVGTAEPERIRAGLRRLRALLSEAKIEHVFYESPSTDHEWQTWRRSLKDFAPRRFR